MGDWCPIRRVGWTVRIDPSCHGEPAWVVRDPSGQVESWWPVRCRPDAAAATEHPFDGTCSHAAEWARQARYAAHRWANR